MLNRYFNDVYKRSIYVLEYNVKWKSRIQTYIHSAVILEHGFKLFHIFATRREGLKPIFPNLDGLGTVSTNRLWRK